MRKCHWNLVSSTSAHHFAFADPGQGDKVQLRCFCAKPIFCISVTPEQRFLSLWLEWPHKQDEGQHLNRLCPGPAAEQDMAQPKTEMSISMAGGQKKKGLRSTGAPKAVGRGISMEPGAKDHQGAALTTLLPFFIESFQTSDCLRGMNRRKCG